MRNVIRGQIPDSLGRDADQWLKELREELDKDEPKNKKRITSLENRYNQPDVRISLKKMYSNFCCYCEAHVAVVKAEQIEHLRPKNKFPDLTYQWENLHLVCGGCNRAKSNKWNDDDPILDPVLDVPISAHLEYKNYRLNPIDKRGETTIEHADLDRDELEGARLRIMVAVIDLMEAINKNPGPKSRYVRRQLDEMANDQFGSLVQHLTSNADKFKLVS